MLVLGCWLKNTHVRVRLSYGGRFLGARLMENWGRHNSKRLSVYFKIHLKSGKSLINTREQIWDNCKMTKIRQIVGLPTKPLLTSLGKLKRFAKNSTPSTTGDCKIITMEALEQIEKFCFWGSEYSGRSYQIYGSLLAILLNQSGYLYKSFIICW